MFSSSVVEIVADIMRLHNNVQNSSEYQIEQYNTLIKLTAFAPE